MYIKGMCCKSCSKAIEAQVSKFEFISQIEIDPKSGKAEFEIIGAVKKIDYILITAITDLGYTVN